MADIDYGAILRANYEAYNNRDFDRMVANALPDAKMMAVAHGTSVSPREYAQTWANAFPDSKVEVLSVVAQGDKVVGEFIGRGTHTGELKTPLGNIPATNKRVEIRFLEIYDCRNGKLGNGRAYFDTGTMMRQLGITMPMQQGKPAQQQPTPRH